MTIKSNLLQRITQALLLLTSALIMSIAVQAQNTSSSLRVLVTDGNGNSLNNVAVQITHLPTGRRQVLSTNADGILTARGLAVGGPYQIDTVKGSNYKADTINDVYLELDQTYIADMIAAPSGATLEEVIVIGREATQTMRAGVGQDFSRATIDATPSISRDFVSTISIDPKILVDNSVARGPAVSMAGQNFRFNSVTIDGVAQNDNFGLSKNASATQRSPISIDAIEAINVNLAPYDVTYGNFIGGNINIVTKSGTNEFHGSVFGYTTDDSLTGDTTEGGQKLGIGDFEEDTYGFTLGGPIIQDQLFFFANYEKFKTTLPSNSQTIDNVAGVTQADIDEVISIFNTEYGFDPGRFAATDTDQDEKLLLKVDWFINDDHRAVATYQVADGDVLFDDFPEVAVLQSNRYNINEKLTAFSFQAFSTWSDDFTTEFKYGIKDVENRQISINGDTPDFAVTAPGGGMITAGGDRFRHTNELDNESRLLRLKGDYTVGDHTLTGGFEQERNKVRNLFLPFSKGNYIFNSIEDLRNRQVGFVLYGNSNSGIPVDAEANFELTTNSMYVQDEWIPTDDLSLTFGLRYDKLSNNDLITENPSFFTRRGFTNQENLDGKDMLLPRFGFNYTPTDRLTVRGGAGLFGGGAPLIMLSNSYAGDGISRTFAQFLAPFFGPPVSDAIDSAVAVLPDPNAAFNFLQPFIGTSPDAATDVIAPEFEILRTWKYSLGLDYTADLSRFGMGDDWDMSVEAIFSNVEEGYKIFEARRQVVGTAPDGRPIYDTPSNGDYVVTNTGDGGSTIYTATLAKSFDTNAGLFSGTLGYTFQDVDEIQSYNRFVTFETYAMDPQSDLNNPQKATSRYQTEHSISATVNWQKELFGANMTSVGLVYSGRSGRHYSHVFGSAGNPTFGGIFLADFGSEGDNPGSQLFYVPTGVNDPIVTGDPTFLANLNTYIDGEKCLSGLRGTIVKRNGCQTDWINSLNLRVAQEIGLGKSDRKLELSLDIENLLNLLNEDWGRVNSYAAPSNLAVANVALSTDGSQYVLTPTSGSVTSARTIVPRPSIARLPSVYRIQLGFRFSF